MEKRQYRGRYCRNLEGSYIFSGAEKPMMSMQVSRMFLARAMKAGYIALIALAKNILETCIDILGFSAPEKM